MSLPIKNSKSYKGDTQSSSSKSMGSFKRTITVLPSFAKSIDEHETFIDYLMRPINYLRSKFSAGSVKGSILTLISSTIGGGCLGFPKSIEASGLIFGVGLTIFAGLLCYYSTMLLVKCGTETKIYSMSRIAKFAYGKAAEIFVKAVIFFFYWSGCAYLSILTNTGITTLLPQIWPNHPKYMSNWYFWPPIYTIFLIFPLNLPRELKALRYFCLIKFMVILFVAFAIVYKMFDPAISSFENPNDYEEIKLINISGLPISLPNILFAYLCHANVLNVYKELKGATERRMSKVLKRTIISTTFIYIIFGTAGYLTFSSYSDYNNIVNDDFPPSILSGKYQNSQLIIIANTMITMTLLIGLTLNAKPAQDTMRDFLFPFDINDPNAASNKDSTIRHVILVIGNSCYQDRLLINIGD